MLNKIKPMPSGCYTLQAESVWLNVHPIRIPYIPPLWITSYISKQEKQTLQFAKVNLQ